ncbi:alpha/beta hydrolase family protein [Dyadobacter aurulentus]|uniref:alpha/beta hydrolase family protein n=1 Tax=Dyadobacter sp. UC 10 TaxID=2605428 RepID=UPI0011F3A477|nr:alpha/beta fold hydrolase [Dyadobacter sp. UC 10]KAA0991938.1 alpha/beta fold hydrolase [Dyadobacter sp. UC 10]
MNKKVILISIVVAVVVALVYVVLSEKPAAKKYQEPVKPYPYYSEDVTFKNSQAGITLSGTLTLPEKEGSFPVVVLVTGGGPQDRNSEVLGHKPFLVISDYLTRKGIAVLRYDDRGTAKSTGQFITGTSLDFATDAESAVAYLKTRKEINPKKIGIAGHSDGGLVASIVASRTNDLAFVISLAGPGATGVEVLSLQSELIARAGGASEADIAIIKKANRETNDIIRQTTDTSQLRAKLTAYTKTHLQNYPAKAIRPGMTKEEAFERQINSICTPFFRFLFQVNPADYFSKITCPVLALIGSKDLQVDARQNLPAIEKAVKSGGNANVTVQELPDLNHFFQKCKTGHPSEYADLEDTFSPIALAAMSDWILAQVK